VCINGIGITPDVVVELKISKDGLDSDDKGSKKDNSDVDEVFSNLEDKNKKSISPDQGQDLQNQKDLDDNQLQSAINVIKGIKIYSKFQQQ